LSTSGPSFHTMGAFLPKHLVTPLVDQERGLLNHVVVTYIRSIPILALKSMNGGRIVFARSPGDFFVSPLASTVRKISTRFGFHFYDRIKKRSFALFLSLLAGRFPFSFCSHTHISFCFCLCTFLSNYVPPFLSVSYYLSFFLF